MSSIAVPMTARIASVSAKQLVAKDRARAQKFLQGINPHGPKRTHEYRRKHHHGKRTYDVPVNALLNDSQVAEPAVAPELAGPLLAVALALAEPLRGAALVLTRTLTVLAPAQPTLVRMLPRNSLAAQLITSHRCHLHPSRRRRQPPTAVYALD
jgi:hypothetical protein